MYVNREMAINEPRHPSPVKFVHIKPMKENVSSFYVLYANFYATSGPDNTPSGRHFAGDICN